MIMSPATANDQYWPCGLGFYTVAISPCGADYEVHLRSKGVPGFRPVSALFARVHREKARWTHNLFSNV
jgi:hypothetical protein